MSTSIRELALSEIREIIQKPVSVFSPDDTLSKVLGALKEADRYEAAVESGGAVGIVTLRDLLDVDQPSRTKLDRVWRATGSVPESASFIDVAETLIRNNIRALPVVEGGRIVGIISQEDLVYSMCDARELSTTPAKELMRSPVLSLDTEEKIAFARNLMLRRDFSHIPIV
ncbi:MAG: CBS domain-containing protein, partial [Candidatus Bathyarchaeota archaeon]|nr:CBS domain-containing protein [Candidatus Bathyarchaeota archaeon]